jgi:PAS domain S-box-containing protein
MIRINDLGLRTRGILLVTFPVLCQLLFVACLLVLLFEAQQDAQREAHSKTVIAQVQLIENNVGNGAMSAIMYQASNGMMGEEMTERDIADVKKEIDKLAKLTAEDKVQTENVHRIYLASGPMSENRRILNQLTGAERNTYRQKMEKSGYPQEKAFLIAILAVVDQENETRRRNPEQKQVWRSFINILMTAAIAASIALAFILSKMYSTSVAQRLARVAENSQRLSKRQTMQLPLEGSDEIAELDAVLHQVDEVITVASEREKALVENSADIICSIDRDGLFLRVNEASIQTLGYAPQELIGKTAVSFAAVDDANLMTQNIGQSAETDSGHLFECRMHRKDNQFVDTLWSTYWSQPDKALFPSFTI